MRRPFLMMFFGLVALFSFGSELAHARHRGAEHDRWDSPAQCDGSADRAPAPPAPSSAAPPPGVR